MKAGLYLKDRMLAIICWGAASLVSGYFLAGLSATRDAVIYVEALFAAAFWVPLVVDGLQRAAWYRDAKQQMDSMDRKFQLMLVLEPPSFSDGQIACELMDELSQDMYAEVAVHEKARREYREYLERWIHEIKTPIATARLTAQTHPSPEMRSVEQDLARIEGYVMQALYHARSSALEKDYLIEKVPLSRLVDDALKRNARELIRARFRIEKPELSEIVYTDPKWIAFVLDQIIQNTVKYAKGGEGVLRFAAAETDSACVLTVEDEGIGVDPKDLPRIFDKGYTGTTGRAYAKSTGMGLYISARLLEQMNLSIRAEHGSTGGLALSIRFPKGDMHSFLAEHDREEESGTAS